MENKGFTLIEILVTMTIMAVVAGLALVSYQGARRSARDGKRKSNLEEIRGASEMYRADTGAYPLNLSTLEPNYIVLPSDPITSRNYSFNRVSGSVYNLCAALEIDTGDDYSADCGSCGAGVTCNYKVTNP